MTPLSLHIKNGSPLSVIHTDTFKTGMLAVTLSLPRRAELVSASLLLCGMLRRGCEKYPSSQALNRRLDELYASFVEIKSTHFGRTEAIQICAELLDSTYIPDKTDVLDGVCEVISQLLLHPIAEQNAFPVSALEKEKQNVCDALRAEINNPRAYALARCHEMLYETDRDYPTADELLDTVSAMDSRTLYDAYRRILRDAELRIFYVGSETEERIVSLCERYFGTLGTNAVARPAMNPERPSGLCERTDRMPVRQGKLVIGFRTGACMADADYPAHLVANELFGGSPASKLFLNVRERMGLCYHCSSSYHALSGHLFVCAGIEPDKRSVTEAEIDKQWQATKDGAFSEAELAAAKLSLCNAYRQMPDNPFDLHSFYTVRQLFGIEDTIEDTVKRVCLVTPEQVAAAARTWQKDAVYFLHGTLPSEEGDDEE
ncbi:MAG: insulinase family protein [Ruminococcaceae bacterium]|nr:insulinase family protein [Oscillospiraceae bacterium]